MNLNDLKSAATGKYELIDALLIRASEPMGGNHKWQNLTIRDTSGDYEISAYYDETMPDLRVEQEQVGQCWQFRVRAVRKLNFINLQGHINGQPRKETNMPTVDDLKKSPYLQQADCEPPLKLTIREWTEEDLSRDNEPTEMKYVLHFREDVKPFVLNVTNFERISQVTGEPDCNNWNGHEITLYRDKNVMMGQKKVGGIRVFVPQPDMSNAVRPQSLPQGVTPATKPEYRGEQPPPATDDDVPDDVDDY